MCTKKYCERPFFHGEKCGHYVPPRNIRLKNLFIGIVVLGGPEDTDSAKSIEILNENGTIFCKLDKLPNERHLHTHDGRILCGGEPDPKNCLKFKDGNWVPFANLIQMRAGHVSWKQDCETRLIGGYYSPNSTEVVSQDGSATTIGFPLKYNTR